MNTAQRVTEFGLDANNSRNTMSRETFSKMSYGPMTQDSNFFVTVEVKKTIDTVDQNRNLEDQLKFGEQDESIEAEDSARHNR